jgi:hypothetical protein
MSLRVLESQQKYKKVHGRRSDLVSELMLASKNVYNTAIYFQKRWYELYNLICQHQIDHLDQCLPHLTRADVQALFKFAKRTGDRDAMYALYTAHNDPILLKVVNDDHRVSELSSMSGNRQAPLGSVQSYKEILNTIAAMDGSPILHSYSMRISESQSQQLNAFIQDLKNVLKKSVENKTITETRRQLKKESMKKESMEKKRDKKTRPSNILPPAYLGEFLMDLYCQRITSSYKSMSSQAAQQTVKKVDQAYKSFFSYGPACQPRYNRTQKYNLVFQKKFFSHR